MRAFFKKHRRIILGLPVIVLVLIGISSGALAALFEDIIITYTPYVEPKDTPPTLVTLITTADEGPPVELIGDITDTGGSTIIERGFVWGLQHCTDPGDIDPNETGYGYNWLEEGEFGLGEFGYYPPDLLLDTDYYGRAVALNAIGWSYGNEVVFDPLNSDEPGSALLRNMLRILLAGVILLGVIQFSRLGGVAMLMSAVVGIITFGIIDILVITLL